MDNRIEKWFKGKRAACILAVLFTVIVCTLAYAITLGLKQREALIELHEAADRIMVTLEEMEAAEALKEKEKAEVLNLENKTAEEMKVDE